MSAMLAAVELYNKPRIAYRDEVTVVLVVNAWELVLKAMLRKADCTLFYRKKRKEPYRSLSIDDALARVSSNGLWPAGIDGAAVTANVKALTAFRDRAIHLYNAPDLGRLMFPFLQQNLLNFRDLVVETFNRDLADAMTWRLLPLGAVAPDGAVPFMRVDTDVTAATEVQSFIEALRGYVADVEAAGGDVARFATVYDVNMVSIKKVTSADLVVAVSPDGEGSVVVRKTDPNETHPFTLVELLAKVNAKRAGRPLNTHDHKVLCWKEGLRSERKFAWKHEKGQSITWSGDALSHMVSLSDEYFDQLRAEYRAQAANGRS
jgi:hypothetical protein